MRRFNVALRISLSLVLTGCGLGLGSAQAQVGSVAIGAPDHVQENLPVYRFDTRALRVPIDTRQTTATPLQSPRNVSAPDIASRLNNLEIGRAHV